MSNYMECLPGPRPVGLTGHHGRSLKSGCYEVAVIRGRLYGSKDASLLEGTLERPSTSLQGIVSYKISCHFNGTFPPTQATPINPKRRPRPRLIETASEGELQHLDCLIPQASARPFLRGCYNTAIRSGQSAAWPILSFCDLTKLKEH
ncbi:MAG: hypothetical protein GX589_04340 [Deltaproteobacteria bacterium]|nr:hypothetical protein [Deltaproteobacteria bacterium]